MTTGDPTYDTAPRIHLVDCSLISGHEGTASYDEAERLSNKLAKYARKLGFNVTHDNVDRAAPSDPLATILADMDQEAPDGR